MKIGRLYINAGRSSNFFEGRELFYKDETNGRYYDLLIPHPTVDDPGNWECRRVRQLWRGFWWVCDPGWLEFRNFYDCKPFLCDWTPAP